MKKEILTIENSLVTLIEETKTKITQHLEKINLGDKWVITPFLYEHVEPNIQFSIPTKNSIFGFRVMLYINADDEKIEKMYLNIPSINASSEEHYNILADLGKIGEAMSSPDFSDKFTFLIQEFLTERFRLLKEKYRLLSLARLEIENFKVEIIGKAKKSLVAAPENLSDEKYLFFRHGYFDKSYIEITNQNLQSIKIIGKTKAIVVVNDIERTVKLKPEELNEIISKLAEAIYFTIN